MRVSVPRESALGESRVALTPEAVSRLTAAGIEVAVERGAGVDHPRVVGVAAGSDVRPVAERRTESLAAGGHEVPQRTEGCRQVGVDGAPPEDLGVEDRQDPGVHPVAHRHEVLGGDGVGRCGRAVHPSMLRTGRNGSEPGASTIR